MRNESTVRNGARYVGACVLTCACAALAGAGVDRWWELHTPAEQKKILVEYEAYLQPQEGGWAHAKYKKALAMFADVKGQEGKIVTAAIAWSDAAKKDAESGEKPSFYYRIYRLQLLNKLIQLNSRSKGELVKSMPDRMIDEYFWFFTERSTNPYDQSQALTMIGNFGPRASKYHDPILDLVAKSGTLVGEAKVILPKIKKK